MKVMFVNYKKIVASFVSIIITIMCMFDFSTNTTATNTNRRYRVYDADNHEYIGFYDIDAVGTSFNARTIFGNDDRVIDWTKSGTVKIMSSTYYRGTGFVIDKHTIATAAHTLFSPNRETGGYVKDVSIVKLFDSDGNPDIEISPIEFHVPELFVNSTASSSYDERYDYALITVEEDLSAYCTYSLGVATDNFFTSDSSVTITGFPQDYNTNTRHTMLTGSGLIHIGSETDYNKDYIFDCYADAVGGNSGSPIYVTEIRGQYTYNTAIGILIEGFDVCNRGIQFSTDHIQFYLRNTPVTYFE